MRNCGKFFRDDQVFTRSPLPFPSTSKYKADQHSCLMPKDKKDSKKKENKKKEKKVSQATKEDVSPEEPVKSIADLFGASSRDPILEALFKANVRTYLRTI